MVRALAHKGLQLPPEAALGAVTSGANGKSTAANSSSDYPLSTVLYSADDSFDYAVYGRDPCSREQWAEWVQSPSSSAPPQTDIEFDYAREREGDAQ